MADFPNNPLPARLQDSAGIYWLMSEWCNYSCDYCGVPVFFKRSPKRGRSNHAFDHYSVEEWLDAFRGFREKDIAMTITGDCWTTAGSASAFLRISRGILPTTRELTRRKYSSTRRFIPAGRLRPTTAAGCIKFGMPVSSSRTWA
jgi:hypothetical protein